MLKTLLFCSALTTIYLVGAGPINDSLCFCLQNGLRVTTDNTFQEVEIDDFAKILSFLETEYKEQANFTIGKHFIKLREEGDSNNTTIALSCFARASISERAKAKRQKKG